MGIKSWAAKKVAENVAISVVTTMVTTKSGRKVLKNMAKAGAQTIGGQAKEAFGNAKKKAQPVIDQVTAKAGEVASTVGTVVSAGVQQAQTVARAQLNAVKDRFSPAAQPQPKKAPAPKKPRARKKPAAKKPK